MRRQIEVRSLLLGAFIGALAVLCVAAAATKNNADASGNTVAKTNELQMEQVTLDQEHLFIKQLPPHM